MRPPWKSALRFSFLPTPTRRSLFHLLLLSSLSLLSYFLGIHLNSEPLLSPFLTSSSFSSPSPSSCVRHPNLTVLHPSSSSSSSPPLDFAPHHLPPPILSHPTPPFPFCPSNFTHHCPCQDPSRELLFPTADMSHRERHCPEGRPPRCRVPRPDGYRTPLRWPEIRDRAWFKNVPSKKLSTEKKKQNWVRVEGEWLVFPGGGTSFPHGVDGYVEEMAKIVPIRSGEIRTALDIGCGVASFGGRLLDYNVLTLSVAPRDIHESQVQFALERGIPAMLGVLGVHRLPYPSRSFDMAHCARCLIPWAGRGGLYLLEIDRILRPGGYWVLSGPPINWKQMYKGWERQPADLESEQKAIEDLARKLCWTKFAEKGPIAVWKKPNNHVHCAKESRMVKSLPFCKTADLDAAWYRKMDTCISPLPDVEKSEEKVGVVVEKWPKRLVTIPQRVSRGDIKGITAETFKTDLQIWKQRLSHYEGYVQFSAGRFRNVIDMNAGLGGFAAALNKYPVWVMNTVPYNSKNNTLGIVYERGLIGTYMDWCEAFSTYPRTYDFIHADRVFSMYNNMCDISDILLEMDRILRPEGAVIIRDHVDFIVKAKRVADRLKWQSRIVQNEKGPFDPEKLLVVDNSVNLSTS